MCRPGHLLNEQVGPTRQGQKHLQEYGELLAVTKLKWPMRCHKKKIPPSSSLILENTGEKCSLQKDIPAVPTGG